MKRKSKNNKSIMIIATAVIAVVVIGLIVLLGGNKGDKLKAEMPEPSQVGFYFLKDGSLILYGAEEGTLVINSKSQMADMEKQIEKRFNKGTVDNIVIESYPENLIGIENIIGENTVIYAPKDVPEQLSGFESRIKKASKGSSFVCSNCLFEVAKVKDNSFSLIVKHGVEVIVLSDEKVNVKLAETDICIFASMPLTPYVDSKFATYYLYFYGEGGDLLQVKEVADIYQNMSSMEKSVVGVMSGKAEDFILMDYDKD